MHIHDGNFTLSDISRYVNYAYIILINIWKMDIYIIIVFFSSIYIYIYAVFMTSTIKMYLVTIHWELTYLQL